MSAPLLTLCVCVLGGRLFDIGYPRFLAATGEPQNSSSAVVKHTVAWQLAKGSTSQEMTRGTTTCLYICLSSHYLSLSPLIHSSILPIFLFNLLFSTTFYVRLSVVHCSLHPSLPFKMFVGFQSHSDTTNDLSSVSTVPSTFSKVHS